MNLPVLAEAMQFRDKLAELVAGDEYLSFDWPDYSNTGDHLIWLGATAALHSLGKRCRGVFTAWQARTQPLPEAAPAVTIVCSGGGNFGDIYPNFQRSREVLLDRYAAHRVVVLPQTIHFASAEAAAASARVFTGHRDVHVFGRDRESARLARQFAPGDRALLAPDCAFFLFPFVARLLALMPPPEPRCEVLQLARTDGEKRAFPGTAEASTIRVDWVGDNAWAEELVGERLRARIALAHAEAPVALGPLNGAARKSLEYLCLGIETLSLGRRIVTDRLHAHILGCMMSKDQVFLDNSYGKNRRFHEAWTSTVPFVEFRAA